MMSFTPDPSKKTKHDPRFTYARIIFFIALCILIVTSANNTAIAIILTGTLGLLGSKIFEDFFETAIEKFDQMLPNFNGRLPEKLLFKVINSLKSHYTFAINCFISLLILALLVTTLHDAIGTFTGNVNDALCLHSSIPWPACNTGIGTTNLSNGVRVGLITYDSNPGPFDQTGLNGEEKKAENLIFQEDEKTCTTPQRITLAVVTMLSRTVEDPSGSANNGIADLQGAYLAQQEYNASHPQLKLCLTIANLGTLTNANKTSNHTSNADYSLSLVIKQIVQFAHYDATFHGIIGFPYSTQSQEAYEEFTKNWPSVSLPIISPSASSNALSNINNFYHIVSPDASQNQVMAQFFCSSLLKNQSSAPIDIFTENDPPPDLYSNSLQVGFENELQRQCPNKLVRIDHDVYKNNDAPSIQQAADNALKKHDRYIFFPDYNTDLGILETELKRHLDPNSTQAITILGGDGLYDSTGVTYSPYFPIYATVFASPLSTTSLSKDPSTAQKISHFIAEYKKVFSQPPLTQSTPVYTLFPAHTILAYDATTAFTETAKNFKTADFQQSTFNKFLSSIAFDGVSGRITFQGNGISAQYSSSPSSGYVYMMCTDHYSQTTHLVAQYESINMDGGITVHRVLPDKQEPQAPCS
ncbi:MAG TPA: hypothetical protein VL485_18255 [Ktedonobacteraceae bacterium]|jgi:hypothetical protein|nr:hypothetical protein [Ktedonobacteraceae bacterium]